MNVLVALLTLLLLAGVIALISSPLLSLGNSQETASEGPQELGEGLQELRTAREAKYRELRDLELDYKTGKLSRGDYEATDATLRAEAVEILNRLEQLESQVQLTGSG